MDKSNLEQVAVQLASAEFYCKSLNKIAVEEQNESANSQIRTKLTEALAQVEELTLEANKLRFALPELKGKHYWWDVPFTTQEVSSFDDTFCFDDGIYIESDKVCSVLDGIRWLIQPQKEHVPYSQISSRLTDSSTILFYLNKKQLLNNINNRFERRYIYNVMSVTRYYEVISHMNPGISPVALALSDYRQQQELLMQEQQARLDEAQQEHDRRWDIYEMISHNSLMTNKERWLYGAMKDIDYFNEDAIRGYYAYDKARKIKKEFEHKLSGIREDSMARQNLARKRYIKSETSITGTANIIRIFPVGEVIYCNSDLVGIFGYKTPQQVAEFDCDDDVTLSELSGSFYTKKELFIKVPNPVPLARHIALNYAEVLPKYNVLSPCPKGCSDELWRVWAEIRFLTNSNYNITNNK